MQSASCHLPPATCNSDSVSHSLTHPFINLSIFHIYRLRLLSIPFRFDSNAMWLHLGRWFLWLKLLRLVKCIAGKLHSPFTSYQLPVTSYHVPVTPFTIYNLKGLPHRTQMLPGTMEGRSRNRSRSKCKRDG